MWRKRIIWILLMLSAGLMYLFENGKASSFLGLCILVVPVIECIWTYLSSKELSYEIIVESTAHKGEDVENYIVFHNYGKISVNHLIWTVTSENIRTGEKNKDSCSTMVQKKSDCEQKFTFEARHSGVYEIKIADVYVEDMFGIFQVHVMENQSAECVVWPKKYDVEVIVKDSGLQNRDSEEYSDLYSGNDMSETFAIREYVPGDSVKQIHWKLSEKTDRLLIRELGRPLMKDMLLLWETNMDGEEDIDIQDVALDAMLSLGGALLKQEVSFEVGFCDVQQGGYSVWSVQTQEDMRELCTHLLRVQAGGQIGTITEHYVNSCAHCNYAHVVVISGMMQRNMKDLYMNNQVLCLSPKRGTKRQSLQSDGTNYYAFRYDRVKDEMDGLVI